MEKLIILIVTGLIIKGIVNRTRRKRQVRTRQTVTRQTVSGQVNNINTQLAKIIQAERKEVEKLRKEDIKQADKIRIAQFKANQARNDMEHYRQQQADYMKLYNHFERIANDTDRTDKTRQAAFVRCINIDNKIRSINRNIENADYKIDTYERLRNN